MGVEAMKRLPVNEIFYSLQGEGGQSGMAMCFVRLSHCNLSCPYCDTEFAAFQELLPEAILQALQAYPTHNLLWTGGEPTLSIDEEVIDFFRRHGYRQSIETNGTRPVPPGLDWVTVSPKPEAFPLLKTNFPSGVNEWRFPFGAGAPLPPSITALPPAQCYCLSPIIEADEVINSTHQTLQACMDYIMQHPEWRLSIQLHKLLGFR